MFPILSTSTARLCAPVAPSAGVEGVELGAQVDCIKRSEI